MSWECKVLWSEGLFLQPHHFQQHDRYVESLVAGIATGLTPYAWGVRELLLDDALLKLGKIALKSCAGVTPDGASFRVPETSDHPPALDVPETVRNAVVYLAVPSKRQGAVDVDMAGEKPSTARFLADEIEVTDSTGQDRQPQSMAIAKLQLRLVLDIDGLSDQLIMPIARISEVRPDKEIVLDRSFIPSCTDIRAAAPLADFLRELEGMLSHRAEALAGRLGQEAGAKGVAEIADFLLLMTINRTLPQIRQLQTIANVHPVVIHRLLVGLAGELATFMSPEKLAGEFPPYRHDDLTNSMQPVFQSLRGSLSTVLEQNAVAVPIEPRKYGVSVAQVADKQLLTSASFVLAVKADVPAESVRRHFPTQAKLGPVEEIRQLVNSALPGIDLHPLPVAPRQIPYHAGAVYFELDGGNPYWKQMNGSGGMAVHVSGEFPGLQMELWALRRG